MLTGRSDVQGSYFQGKCAELKKKGMEPPMLEIEPNQKTVPKNSGQDRTKKWKNNVIQKLRDKSRSFMDNGYAEFDCLNEANFCCISKSSFKASVSSLWATDPPRGSRQ